MSAMLEMFLAGTPFRELESALSEAISNVDNVALTRMERDKSSSNVMQLRVGRDFDVARKEIAISM